MLPKKVLYCPVGEHVTLGYHTKGFVSSYACTECQWIFTWDKNGKLLPPTKIIPLKKRELCDCGACQFREERKRFRTTLEN